MSIPSTPIEDRFDARAVRTDGCWLWDGRLSGEGYARIWDAPTRKTLLAHRYSYERFVGPIPDGFQIDHLCRNRGCVNPEHLEPVTQAENIRRGMSPQMVVHRTGRCGRGHDQTPENVYRRRSNGQVVYCKICYREGKRRRDAA